MATDYDAPRATEETKDESLEELALARDDKTSGRIDHDENEAAEEFELPGADLSDHELAIEVTPQQPDEFVCTSCFLVHHRGSRVPGTDICHDCT